MCTPVLKWSTPLTLMATVKTQMVSGERWRENYKNDGSSTAGQLGNTSEVDNMRFKDTLKQKYMHDEYPQVRKYMKAAHRGPTCERL